MELLFSSCGAFCRQMYRFIDLDEQFFWTAWTRIRIGYDLGVLHLCVYLLSSGLFVNILSVEN